MSEVTTREKLKEQVLQLILFQGNRFIKELLRSKKLPLGGTKIEFQKHLLAAIEGGRLTEEDIEVWLEEVEGWGDQHAYIYVAPSEIREAPRWRNSAAVKHVVEKAGYGEIWNAQTSFLFPEEMRLTRIQYHRSGLTFLWQQGLPSRVRREDLDQEGTVEGEEIIWEAYLRQWGRAVLRFDWRLDLGLAGIFLGRAKDQSQYAQRRDEILAMVRPVIDLREWTPLDIPRAISALDTLDLHQGGEGEPKVRATDTLFVATGGSVRLTSTLKERSYQDDALVREVRRVVDTSKFLGGAGDFYLAGPYSSRPRELHLRLYGRERRILFWGRMKAEEVWGLIAEMQKMIGAPSWPADSQN